MVHPHRQFEIIVFSETLGSNAETRLNGSRSSVHQYSRGIFISEATPWNSAFHERDEQTL